MAMAMPNVTGGAATSGANGDNELSQTVRIGDYQVSPPSWVKKTGMDPSMVYMLGFAVIVGGIVLWKLKK